MKKIISLFLAFIIVSGAMAGLAYAIGYLFDLPSLYQDGTAFIIGLSAGLGGTFGPMIFNLIVNRAAK